MDADGQKCLSGHTEHERTLSAPMTGLYEPSGQGTGPTVAIGQKEPGGHGSVLFEGIIETPAGQRVPVGQGCSSITFLEVVTFEQKNPGEQMIQSELPKSE